MKKENNSNQIKYDISYTQNRELSWLHFNERVLEEAQDLRVPLYERLKFVSIFESNLDEFFMIRVGSLTDIALLKEAHIDNKSGWTAQEQLNEIFKHVIPLYRKRDHTFEEIENALRGFGVSRVSPEELDGSEKKYIDKYFSSYILPVLSPQIIDLHHPFPHLTNNVLHILLELKTGEKTATGILPVTPALPTMVVLKGNGFRYILMEQILQYYASKIFEKCEITACAVIKVTRNADISADDENYDIEDDYRLHMKKVLKKRTRLSPVRLEIQGHFPDRIISSLCNRLQISRTRVFHSKAPLKMGYVFSLADKLPDGYQISYPEFSPQSSPRIDLQNSVLSQIEKKDLLLHYPYESMKPFLHLLREAAYDSTVISIKITIYRLARTSKLMSYLIEAAENGKDVTVLMELRARFDEQNNIDWAERLEDAGCTVLYGIEGFKVHSKICLITRRKHDTIHYITQIGTGNFNEKTVKLYTDLALITASPEIGADAANFFKNMSIGNLEGEYQHLLVAPINLKTRILSCIDEEIAKANRGEAGEIRMKLNSLTDREIITHLSQASCAGVQVRLIIRGICCLLPGIAGKTDNIEIHSIVGRYLEHARIYCFGKGVQCHLFIGSADLMTRNTEKRVEIACPVTDPMVAQRLDDIWEIQWHDNVKSRILQSDGSYHKPKASNYTPINCQQQFIELAQKNTVVAPTPTKHHTEGFFNKLRNLFSNN